jgi:hypothetical protein
MPWRSNCLDFPGVAPDIPGGLPAIMEMLNQEDLITGLRGRGPMTFNAFGLRGKAAAPLAVPL